MFALPYTNTRWQQTKPAVIVYEQMQFSSIACSDTDSTTLSHGASDVTHVTHFISPTNVVLYSSYDINKHNPLSNALFFPIT